MSSILVVDDDKALCRSLELQLKINGHEIRSALSAEEGLNMARNWSPDCVLLDLNLPGESGIEALPRFLENSPESTVVIMTADTDNQVAVAAMRAGAYDYLRKPFDVNDALGIIAKVSLRKSTTSIDNVYDVNIKEPLSNELIGSHPTILEIHKHIGLLSRSRVNILIQGESGTGKELAARILHNTEGDERPFVAVNCSAVVPTLLESEFFGHEKGAFTGADNVKIGKLEYAALGTFFLDEIGDMPFDLQGKLLRVLQEEEFVRVGGLVPIPLKARIVAATHHDLAKLVDEGKFRQDLYYRLTVSTLMIPPLRERRDDIPLLVAFLLRKISCKLHRHVTTVENDAINQLKHYDFPGNVRELENVLTRAVALAKGHYLTAEDLEFSLGSQFTHTGKCSQPVTLAEAEKMHIRKFLDLNNWNITRTAKILKISPTTLRKKITDYQLKHL